MKKIFPIVLILLCTCALTLICFGSCGSKKGSDKNEEKTPQYTVTFDANGGELSEESRDKYTAKENTLLKDTVKKLPEASYEGYAFGGWFCDEKEYNENDAVTKDMTFSAKWIKCYTVKFNANGGDFSEETVAEFTVTDGQTLGEAVILPETTQIGFNFDGWYNGDILYNANDTVSEDTTFYAEWIADMSIMTEDRIEGTWKTTVRMMDVLEANKIKELPTGFSSSAKLTGYFSFKDGKVTIFAVKKDLMKAAEIYLEDLADALRDDGDLIYNVMKALYNLNTKKEVDEYISENPPYFKALWKEAIIALVPDQDVEELLSKVLDSEGRYVLVKNAKYTVDAENDIITIGDDTLAIGSVSENSFKITDAEGKSSGYKNCKLTKQQ